MRIAIVSLHTSPTENPGTRDAGGMNVVINEQARALSQLGHKVEVFTRASSAIAPGETFLREAPGVKVTALQAGPPEALKEELPEYLDEFAEKLEPFLDHDVVHSHYWLSGSAVARAAAHATPKHFLTLHTVGAHKAKTRVAEQKTESNTRLQEEALLINTVPVIATSISELQQIEEAYGQPLSGSHVINPGVDTELFQPNQADQSHFDITLVARLQPLKGVDFAIEVFAELLRLIQDDKQLKTVDIQRPRLVIVGEATPGDAGYVTNCKRLAEANGLTLGSDLAADADVIFLGGQLRQATAEIISRSSLIVIPSVSETFGLVALEAAASATPVIANNTTGLKESVINEVSGFLIEKSVPLWAGKIAELLGNPKTLEDLSRSAREYAKKHSWLHHAEKLVEAYLGEPGHTR